jgi:site-specific DNA-methyltransferase (adenine-specific)
MSEIELLNLPIADIEFKNRARENYKDLDVLAKDIEQKGIIQPIAVMRLTSGKYRLLAGGRRFSAFVLTDKPTIPCRVYPATLTDLDQKEIELMENVSRDDFDWKEEVSLRDAIQKLQEEKHGKAHGSGPGHSMRDTAKMLGTSPMTISRDLTLARGLEEHAEELSKAKNKSEALRTLKKIERQKQEKLVVDNLERDLASDRAASLKRSLSNGYIVTDFFEGVKDVPDRAVSFVEVDPPYAIDLTKIKRGADRNTSPGIENYNEIATEDYQDFLDRLFVECFRVMTPGSWIVCWYGFQWYHAIISSMEEAGFSPCHIPAMWHKVGHQGQTRNPEMRLGSVFEPFIYARKDPSGIIKQPGRTNSFSFKALSPEAKVHPTERPREMIEEVIKTFCQPGGHVMVPFLGSGNTLLAASNRGSTCFGFDLSEEYKNSFIARVMAGEPGKYKSYSA